MVPLLAALVLPLMVSVPSAAASGMAQVRIVDRFHGGRVEVKVNDDIDRKMRYGDRTKFLPVTPASNGYDGISVTWLKYPGCGNGDGDNFFNAGHRYKIVISSKNAGTCGAKGAHHAKSPGFRVVKID